MVASGGIGTGLRVVIGDFNAHHTDWGRTTDRRGRTIKSAMEGGGWTRVTNTPSPSFRRLVCQQVRESTIDLAWTNDKGKARGVVSPGFLASDHAVVVVEVDRGQDQGPPQWVMDWDAAHEEVLRVELMETEREQEIWVASLRGDDPYEKVKGLVARWSKLRKKPAKAKRWYDTEVKEMGKVVRKLGRGGKCHEPS